MLLEVKSLDKHEVMLISPQSPDFDTRLRAAEPRLAPLAMEFKPFVFLVANRSPRDVAAFSLRYAATWPDKTPQVGWAQYNYPYALAGSGTLSSASVQHGVRAGQDFLVGLTFVFGARFDPAIHGEMTREHVQNLRDAFHGATLQIELNAAIFSDGTLAGTDGCDLVPHFEAQLNATDKINRTLVERVREGSSVDEAFRWTEVMCESAQSDPFSPYLYDALGEARRLRKEYMLLSVCPTGVTRRL